MSTWHGAKGLEWPIVALYPLSARDPSTAALGVRAISDAKKIDLANPLDQRWIRFWPNPYLAANKNTPFHGRLDGHPATAVARKQELRESLRVLYVGWTRARDRLALVGRDGALEDCVLELLHDQNGPLITEPKGQTITWGGQKTEVIVREASPLSAVICEPKPSDRYAVPGPRGYPPAFVQPSGTEGDSGGSFTLESIGPRIPVDGKPDWATLGTAVHNFLCADRPGLSTPERLQMLKDLLVRWGVAQHVQAPSVMAASDRFRDWVNHRWPSAFWHREWPVQQRLKDGTIVRKSTDLVLETSEGLVVIDHKSFPGTHEQALDRAKQYVGQLRQYAEMVEAATGKPVVGIWLHLPISGLLLQLATVISRAQR